MREDLSWLPLRHVVIGGMSVTTAGRPELTEAMVHDCLNARRYGHGRPPRLVFDANGHALSLFETDQLYRSALQSADVIHADGGFIVTISRWLAGASIVERSATTDLIHDFAERALQEGLTFFLLGGTESVNLRCARTLETTYPGLKIVGRRDGYFTDAEKEDVIEAINVSKPDIIWVGLGKPREQAFSVEIVRHLRAGWLVTCGGCFNYITGDYKRAPRWMQRANIEWLHRMITNPKQLFWRYLVTTPHAFWIALFKTKPAN